MGNVALILDPQGGVAEIRILPGLGGWSTDRTTLWFASRLGPTVAALDEALRAASLADNAPESDS